MRFLGDARRNRYNSAVGALEISEIFKWYRDAGETDDLPAADRA